MEGVVSVFPNSKRKLHTTHSWDFMGLLDDQTMETLGYSVKNQENIIIGFIDTGEYLCTIFSKVSAFMIKLITSMAKRNTFILKFSYCSIMWHLLIGSQEFSLPHSFITSLAEKLSLYFVCFSFSIIMFKDTSMINGKIQNWNLRVLLIGNLGGPYSEPCE